MDTAQSRLNIVLVEDHHVLRRMLAQVLGEAGHQVTALSCAEELEDVAGGQPADIFLIDLNLPGEDGLSLVRRVRAACPLAGIIIATARSLLQDKLDGYASGADLYLTKPVEVPELCAAVAALARRRQRMDAMLTPQQGLMLSQQQLTLGRPGAEVVHLSAAEAAMLVALARAPGQRLAYWQIGELLGMNLEAQAKANLEVRMVRLRKKLAEAGAAGDGIEAVRGYGYQLCATVRLV